ncbi:uncharacterized protein MONBRDRAFT_30570, partial [Monosiga brevicollis MX1]
TGYLEPMNKSHSGRCVPVLVNCLEAHSALRLRDAFMAEASILKRIGRDCHPSIASLVGVCFHSQPLYVVQEDCEQGFLATMLRDCRGSQNLEESLSKADLSNMCQKLMSAVEFLHDSSVLLMTLNGFTVMMDVHGEPRIVVLGRDPKLHFDGFIQRWLAPEAVESRSYSMAADMYSFGVSRDKLAIQITSQQLLPCPPGCPAAAYDLMRQCWNYYPSARPLRENLPDFVAENRILGGCRDLQSAIDRLKRGVELGFAINLTHAVSPNYEC